MLPPSTTGTMTLLVMGGDGGGRDADGLSSAGYVCVTMSRSLELHEGPGELETGAAASGCWEEDGGGGAVEDAGG